MDGRVIAYMRYSICCRT